ncbi:rod shape-determining protein MreC [Spirulina sp. CS-785/01]|uniref:rod shape-determining protein MreC n=1 Tax=Spirulina sp. CS-785/01 TaxID=3021716 RepID=UPI00233066B0|nr:rod shape-determining protein MreC [Spirulina sp. CS-785/01]MDB9313527.1 rod shape-determining protein MreC [Spirulina sp. CS-785/01]
MFTVRRWWERYGSQFILIGIVLGVALFIRQTQGALIFELYAHAIRPFQTGPPPDEKWREGEVERLEGQLTALEKQNEELKKLLDYKEEQQLESISARIIGRSVDHWWQQIILDQGSNEGVKEGYVVTSPGGLVGRVIKVTPHTSRVLLISDPTSRVGAKLSRNNYMGYIRGGTKGTATMVFYEKVPNVKKGDQVVTSPASQLFPPGIHIGVVESVHLQQNPAPEVEIKLTAPIEFLEWVTIHPHTTKY